MAEIKVTLPERFGPQFKDASPFIRKARLLQSWYRTEVLKQKQFGFGPDRNSKNKYGNVLVNGELTGKNFLTPSIFHYVNYRLEFLKNGETILEYRMYNNMLSSQPMCFNLFFPIKQIFESNTKAADRILQACFPNLQIERVLSIELEYLPYPVDQYLNDRTAFDAMLIYKTTSGKTNILAIETKYVEALGTNRSRDISHQIEVVKNSSVFSSDCLAHSEKGFSQLGRNFMLAERYRKVHHLDEAHAVVIAPLENNSSETEIAEFSKLLSQQCKHQLFYCSLEKLIEAVLGSCPKTHSNWINEFRMRYLGFENIKEYI